MKEIFFKYISELINNEKDLIYMWGDNNSEITIKKKADNGFDVIINYYKDFIYLFTDRGYHDQFQIANNFNEVLIDVMGIVRDLLSKNMRIKEHQSNGKPYKWKLECYINDHWECEGSTVLIFWNYFGKRSEQLFFNDILPVREFKNT